MTEEQYTRCPSCKTVFRVTDAQLALRDGVVRCGHCKTIFDGRAELISLAPQPVDEDALPDEASMGPPTVTLRSSQALRPAPDPAQPEEPATSGLVDDDAIDPKEGSDVDYENRFAWDQPERKRRIPGWAYAVLVPLLLLLLAGQVLYHFRDALAAHWPGTRPMLTEMCLALSCEVRPLRDVAALSIDASDLQVDPAHVGLLILSATVRNRAGYALAYPYLELTLTDGQDQIVVRRAFAPADYLGGTIDISAGIPGNGETALKLFIDASATAQAGYRLYLFYP